MSEREHLAAHAARAVGDDRLVLEVVVAPAVELGHELAGGRDVGHHGAAEPADPRLELVAAVEEGHALLARRARAARRGSSRVAAADHAGLVDLAARRGRRSVTISSRTLTLSRGKSSPVPSLHLASRSRNGAYSRVFRS